MMATQDFAVYPSLRGRAVLVTGGASGIGAAIVEAFAAQGSRVGFFDIREDDARALSSGIASSGAPAPLFFLCDLTDIAALRKAVAAAQQQLGAVDVLVNNAGNDTRHGLEDVTPEFWDQCMAINLRQQFFMIQAVLPSMRRARRGSIVNMSSIGWVIPSTNVPVYVTAKAAVVGMTRTLAHELGPSNIRVNCILPGAVATERQRRLRLTPEYEAEVLAAQALKHRITPEEVARLVLFLAADDSSAITSQSYIIDAGWV